MRAPPTKTSDEMVGYVAPPIVQKVKDSNNSDFLTRVFLEIILQQGQVRKKQNYSKILWNYLVKICVVLRKRRNFN